MPAVSAPGNVARMGQPHRVLLGGGIGSGKSTAGRLFGGYGAAVLSADAAGHRVLEPGGAAEAAVVARWPQTLVGGRVDRASLAAVVFADASARAELEALTHPAIRRLLLEQAAAAVAPVVMVEMPQLVDLLGEGWIWVVVDAPDQVRVARLAARGMSADEVTRRMAAQPSRREWLAAAEVVVDNAGDLRHLAAECERAWEFILSR